MTMKQKRIAAVGLAIGLAVSSLSMQPVRTQAATKKATEVKLNVTKKTLVEGGSCNLKSNKSDTCKNLKGSYMEIFE